MNRASDLFIVDNSDSDWRVRSYLFVLSIYYPLVHWRGDKESPDYKKRDETRQKQVVTLIRMLFLKRFESSAKTFEGSCWRLLQKILAWVTVHACAQHDQDRLKRWKIKKVVISPGEMAAQIRSTPETPRQCALDRTVLSELRKKAEKHIVAHHLRPLQAPVRVSPVLKCWMEIS